MELKMKNLTLIFLFIAFHFSIAQNLNQTQDLINNYQFEKALAILADITDTINTFYVGMIFGNPIETVFLFLQQFLNHIAW